MSNHNKETEARCFHCYRHYVEGTAAWALYVMRMGRKVTNPKHDPRVYHLPEGGMIHVNGIKSIATNQWIDYWCIDIPDGWKIYEEPKPEPEPLLADAKVGDLCKHRNGDWSQIIDTNGTYIPGQPIRTTLKDTNGINRNFCLSGSHFTMQFDGEYDIIATEPLAEVGTAEWAWQMMLLGKMVWNPELDLHKAKRTMSQVLSIYYIDGGNIMVRNLSGERSVLGVQKDSYWAVYAESTGWQLYEEPQPTYKVRDWVEVECQNKLYHKQVLFVTENRVGFEFSGTTPSVCFDGTPSHVFKFIRKLDPSEVVLDFGSGISGTIKRWDSTTFHIFHGNSKFSKIHIDALDTETRYLVESLLKAQEEM